MSRDLATDAAAALQAEHVSQVIFLELAFASGTSRICTREHSVDWNGETWLGMGRVGSIEPISEGGALESRGIAMSLSALPSGLLATALTPSEYKGRQVKLWFGQIAPTSYDGVILADTPVGYWRLGEASGTSVVDSSGNGNTGTYLAGVTDLGEAGLLEYDADTAVAFPGGTGTTLCASWATAPLKTTGAVTIEAWIHPADLASSQGAIARSGQGTDLQFGLWVTSSGALRYQWNDGAFKNIDTIAGVINAGETCHVAFVREANGVDVSFYKNGELLYSTTAVSSCVANATQVLTIGGSSGTTIQNFSGILDEVALYGAALTAEQLKVHYLAGKARLGREVVQDPVGPFIFNMDQLTWQLGAETAALRLTAESRLADWDRPRVRRYNNADHQALHPNDRFFEHVERQIEAVHRW